MARVARVWDETGEYTLCFALKYMLHYILKPNYYLSGWPNKHAVDHLYVSRAVTLGLSPGRVCDTINSIQGLFCVDCTTLGSALVIITSRARPSVIAVFENVHSS